MAKKKKTKKLNAAGIQKLTLKYFSSNPKKTIRFNEINDYLKKKKVSRANVINTLDKLRNAGLISKTGNSTYKFEGQNAKIERSIIGFVDMNKSGSAYVISDAVTKDIYIKPRNTNKSFNGDKVKVELFLEKEKRGKLEGKIVEIIERNQTEFVGTLSLQNNYAFVIPDRNKMSVDFFIPKDKVGKAKEGHKVVVKLKEWKENQRSPIGHIVRVLGKPGLSNVEMNSILIDCGFPLQFSHEVMQETNQLSTKISEAEIAQRRDMRKVPTLTIDPEDAKDFDDALSLQKLDNGNFEFGIHIADVAHYVKPGTELDKAASKRATSVYLVDRVLPMLPEKISNGICSLRPNEEKCTFSAVFEIDENGDVQNQWFGRTVTYSDRRFTYEEAQQVIDTGEGDFALEILQMNKTAKQLRKRRFDKGSISFETDEVRFKFDEEGNPLSVYVKERKEAHLLVEDFMLLANRSVAEFIAKKEKEQNKNIPFPYRVHDLPDIEKLMTLQHYASNFDLEVNFKEEENPTIALNRLMATVKGTALQNLISQLAVRSMAKAKYTTNNIGHFGLAFDHYSHFTSPIRRYPDVLTHRLLANVLADKKDAQKAKVEMQLEHCSKMERKAIDAERKSTKYMQVKFLSDKIGLETMGMISGVKHFGIFVELIDNKCEGLIPIETLPFDKYVYKEAKQEIVGLLNDVVYRLGDLLKVRITKADLEKQTVDFELVTE